MSIVEKDEIEVIIKNMRNANCKCLQKITNTKIEHFDEIMLVF
jgi:hypothetical protein